MSAVVKLEGPRGAKHVFVTAEILRWSVHYGFGSGPETTIYTRDGSKALLDGDHNNALTDAVEAWAEFQTRLRAPSEK